MKKVLWVSRNTPLQSQIDELGRLFGKDFELTIDAQPFASASTIVAKFRRGGFDDMVLIAPLSVCRAVTECGIRPLWSEMKTTEKEDAEIRVMNTRERIENKERCYKFVKFKRLESVTVVFRNLDS